jgi:monofunctional biosynthetic peptidoglycan transglycosylase
MAARNLRRRLLRWLGVAVLLFFAGTILPVVALRYIDPWTSAFMIDARVDALLARDFDFSNSYEWRDLEEISPHAAIAVIASEDQQFAFHDGFDFKSIRQAMRSNAKGRKLRGASTITQQVAKNLFLWKGRSYVRKGLEAWFTVLIEWIWPKERTLEIYLNIAQFGNGIWGVESAAQHFFHKSARRLTRRESATLAAVLPNPIIYRVDAPSATVATRLDAAPDARAGRPGLPEPVRGKRRCRSGSAPRSHGEETLGEEAVVAGGRRTGHLLCAWTNGLLGGRREPLRRRTDRARTLGRRQGLRLLRRQGRNRAGLRNRARAF